MMNLDHFGSILGQNTAFWVRSDQVLKKLDDYDIMDVFSLFKTNFNYRHVYGISISIVFLAFSILQTPNVNVNISWAPISNAFRFDDGYVSFRT